jgi:hypothetical protein
MIANLAFTVGLTLGLAPQAEALMRRVTFGQTRRNFYEAARLGLDAELLWPSASGPSPRRMRVRQLAAELLPLARRGLVHEGGVDPKEADAWLAVIAARMARGLTGARWQRAAWDAAQKHAPGTAAATLLERYIVLSESEEPVHLWT